MDRKKEKGKRQRVKAQAAAPPACVFMFAFFLLPLFYPIHPVHPC
jgi:hypothetical protein